VPRAALCAHPAAPFRGGAADRARSRPRRRPRGR
jgi:hypothetical protein